MLFSCIVPVYNIEKEYLQNCIDSIIHQTFANFELIIVDDGSKQETANLCDSLGQKDSRISVIHQKNKGLAGARNTGVAHAKGEWIVHVDGDDWVEPEMLDEIAKTLNPSVDVILFGYSTNAGNKKNSYLLRDRTIIDRPYDEIKPMLLHASMKCGSSFADIAVNTTWGKAFRREFIESSGIVFNEELRRAQDVPYSLDAFYYAKKIAYIDKALYVYRLDNDSLSRGYNAKTFERMTKTALACQEFCTDHPEYPNLKESSIEFSRKCFRNIVSNDYLNEKNPKDWKTRKHDFMNAIKQEPYVTAFYKENISYSGSLLDYLEIRITSSRKLGLLLIYRKIRSLARKIAGR